MEGAGLHDKTKPQFGYGKDYDFYKRPLSNQTKFGCVARKKSIYDSWFKGN